MAAGRRLEFDPTGNGAVGSAVPENPTLEPTDPTAPFPQTSHAVRAGLSPLAALFPVVYC